MKLHSLAGAAVALIVAVGSHPALAQSDGGLLRGVTSLAPQVLPLDSDSETCGIDAAHVRKVLDEATTGAPFQLDGREYVLFVRLSSLPKHGDCFSSIDVGVYWDGAVTLPANPDGIQAKVKLWENGTILISPNSRHWHEVSGVLEHLVRNLIAVWKEDNHTSG